jgi:hypothetical protein
VQQLRCDVGLLLSKRGAHHDERLPTHRASGAARCAYRGVSCMFALDDFVRLLAAPPLELVSKG